MNIKNLAQPNFDLLLALSNVYDYADQLKNPDDYPNLKEEDPDRYADQCHVRNEEEDLFYVYLSLLEATYDVVIKGKSLDETMLCTDLKKLGRMYPEWCKKQDHIMFLADQVNAYYENIWKRANDQLGEMQYPNFYCIANDIKNSVDV